MAPRLYMVAYSQPVRATLMTIKALNLNVEFININLIQMQQLEEEFTKFNPQHTVPTLVEDDGFVLWDSHAIMAYLVDKYASDDSLYPKDLKKRAIVNQRLYFEGGVLFPLGVLGPIIYNNQKTIPLEKIEKVKEAYSFVEKFLEGQEWVAGSNVTIADFSILSSISTLDVVVPVDPKTFPNVAAWLKRAETLPYFDANRNGLEKIRSLIQDKLK